MTETTPRTYEEGYRDGFKDGFAVKPFSHGTLPPHPDLMAGCPKCGMGADGKPMGYCCPRLDCPSKVTCHV